MRHECGKRETEGAKISQSRTTNEHQIEELEGINQESKRLCKRLSDDFRTLDSPIEGRQMVTTIVESICAKSKCSFHFVHRALELARRRGEIIDDTDEERLEWRETEGKQRLTGKVWSFWSKLEKFEASKNKLLKLCDLWCLAARPQDPQGESILGVFGSEAGKYPKLDERRQRSFVQGTASVFFVWFSCGFLWIFYGASFFSGVEGNNWEAPVQTCDRFALGHSLGTPWILRITGIPRFRPGSSAKRSAKPKSTNSFRHTTSAHGFAHGLHAVYMLLHAVTCCWSPVWFFSEAILISRTWGHLEASSNSIYVCFKVLPILTKDLRQIQDGIGRGPLKDSEICQKSSRAQDRFETYWNWLVRVMSISCHIAKRIGIWLQGHQSFSWLYSKHWREASLSDGSLPSPAQKMNDVVRMTSYVCYILQRGWP